MNKTGRTMEKKQKDKKRRIKFKQVMLWGMVGCICFFAGRLTRYGITELKYAYILYHHEKLLPLWEVYYPYEPIWAGKEYSFRNDYHITYMYEDGREQFERLEEYIKTRNEYMSYNICYQYESEENERNGKLYKRIYEKADSGNLQEADWKEELEDIEFTSEGERLVELGDSWYFRQEICRSKYAETE